jgi:hypothetical protein
LRIQKRDVRRAKGHLGYPRHRRRRYVLSRRGGARGVELLDCSKHARRYSRCRAYWQWREGGMVGICVEHGRPRSRSGKGRKAVTPGISLIWYPQVRRLRFVCQIVQILRKVWWYGRASSRNISGSYRGRLQRHHIVRRWQRSQTSEQLCTEVNILQLRMMPKVKSRSCSHPGSFWRLATGLLTV